MTFEKFRSSDNHYRVSTRHLTTNEFKLNSSPNSQLLNRIRNQNNDN